MAEIESLRRQIRDLHSEKPIQPRFCDLVVINGVSYFEKKDKNGNRERIRTDDFIYQYNAAKQII